MTTDQLDEQWDLYDRDLHRIGTQRRGDPMPPATVHLTVAALLIAPDGRVLLQRRSQQKLSRPGAWEVSAGGSVLRGETPVQAIQREVAEELGLVLPFTAADRFARVPHATWVEDWFTTQLPSLPPLTRQRSEVAELAWLTPATAVSRWQAQGDDGYATALRQALDWLERR